MATKSLGLVPEDHYAVLAAAIRANTVPAIVAALAARDDDTIRDYYNVLTSTSVWREAVTREELFEMMPITVFDGITAGKREAWKLMLEQASTNPLDFGKAKLRAAVRDIWPTVNGDDILNSCTRKATRCELLYGGTVETSGAVSATDLAVEVPELTTYQVSIALNQY
jgi:hypothetical protein